MARAVWLCYSHKKNLAQIHNNRLRWLLYTSHGRGRLLAVIGADEVGLLDHVGLRRSQHIGRGRCGAQIEGRPADRQQMEMI